MSYTPMRLVSPPPGIEALDRLGWAESLAFESHDVRVGIRTTDAASWPRVLSRLPPDAAPIAPVVDYMFSIVVGPAIALYDGAQPILHTDSLDTMFDAAESHVRLQVATASEARLFVHAGVVGWRGKAILLPAPSWSGKSELVVALVQAGATYYSDEYAVIDEHGLVHPYARPPALRESGAPKRRIPLEEISGAVGTSALRAGAIVFTRFEPGASWHPRKLSSAEAVVGLLSNTVRARLDPAVALKRLAQVARGAVAFEGSRGDTTESAQAVLRSCSDVVVNGSIHHMQEAG
jgi:hypothetical protein